MKTRLKSFKKVIKRNYCLILLSKQNKYYFDPIPKTALAKNETVLYSYFDISFIPYSINYLKVRKIN